MRDASASATAAIASIDAAIRTVNSQRASMGTAMLAQANQASQSILQLLG